MEMSGPILLEGDCLHRSVRAAEGNGWAGKGIAQPETRIKGHIEDKNAGVALLRGGI